jgi:hypothetical protein
MACLERSTQVRRRTRLGDVILSTSTKITILRNIPYSVSPNRRGRWESPSHSSIREQQLVAPILFGDPSVCAEYCAAALTHTVEIDPA